MNSVARFVSRIIHWIERDDSLSMKRYNDLKQRMIANHCQSILEKWYVIRVWKLCVKFHLIMEVA